MFNIFLILLILSFIVNLQTLIEEAIQLLRARKYELSVRKDQDSSAVSTLYFDAAKLVIWYRDIKMMSKICLSWIFFSANGNLIVSCDDLLFVRIVYRCIFCPAVAGISYGKMRSGLLSDQDRQFSFNMLFPCHSIGCCVCSDRKFADWQSLMIRQHIFPDIVLIVLFLLKILAGICFYHTIFKFQMQFFIL